jgi:hypothetical protein
LGRVAVAGAKLDVILGQVAVAAGVPVQRPGDGWMSYATRKGGSSAALREVSRLLPADDPVRERVRQLRIDAKRALGERHRMVHSVAVPELPEETGTEGRWLLHHPISDTDHLPTLTDVGKLVAQLNALSARALVVAG